ncbi:MAG: hypothetical protein OCD00_13170 [Colwellia sp.]
MCNIVKLNLLSLLTLSSLLFSYYAMAIQPKADSTVHSLYLEQGTDVEHTYKVIRDNSGFIWSATDNGLKRYDGYQLQKFVHIDNDPTSIGSNSIEELIYVDNELWAGGNNLNKYIPKTESFMSYEVSDGASIWAMHKEKNIIWLGGEGFGLRGYDLNKNKIVFQFLNQGEDRFIYAIEADVKTNKLWVASSSGLFLFDAEQGQFEQYLALDELEEGHQTIEDILVDDKGKVWLVTRRGLINIDIITREIKHYHQGNRSF